jgi:Zn ribbon nucleic-acid-binding protein
MTKPGCCPWCGKAMEVDDMSRWRGEGAEDYTCRDCGYSEVKTKGRPSRGSAD